MSDRISAMVAETNSEMESGESVKSEPVKLESGRGRISSIMNMDYNTDDAEVDDPEENGLSSGHGTPTKSDKKEEVKEEKEPEVKEEKEVVEKEEPQKKTVKYKVDGQEITEEVTDQDLINSYSGQKALQKRFTEFDRSKKEFEREKEQITEKHKYVIDEIGSVENGFRDIVKEFSENGYTKGNPLDTVYNLLDKMNIDTASYEKALFFHMIPQVSEFLDMSDEGRDAYLLRRENEWFHKKQHKLAEGQRANSEQRRKLEEENSVKKQYGVSEEKFAELKDELVNRFGVDAKKIKTENVLAWSQEKPAYDRAALLVEKAGSDKNGIIKIARLVLEHPTITDDEILDALGYKEKQARDLKEKLGDKIPPKAAPKRTVDLEVDEDFNKRFRRR